MTAIPIADSHTNNAIFHMVSAVKEEKGLHVHVRYCGMIFVVIIAILGLIVTFSHEGHVELITEEQHPSNVVDSNSDERPLPL